MKCDACKYAIWRKTAAGRLHPDKSGLCGVEKRIQLPAAFRGLSFEKTAAEGYIDVKGGYIKRGRELSRKCAYYGPIKGGK